MNAIPENLGADIKQQKLGRIQIAKRRLPRSFLLVVFVPSLLAAVYYGLIATPRYVSEADIVVETEESGGASGILASMLGNLGSFGGTGHATGQAHLLVQYIKSPTMLSQLQELINLQALYSNPEADYFSRLKENPTREEFFNYFQSAVEVEFDQTSHILKIRAEAFSPDEAKLIVQTILILSEDLLNKLLLRKQEDIVAFAKREVENAEDRLKKARLALSEFRRDNSDIDPSRSAAAQGGLIASLASQLAAARAELTSSLAFLKPESTQIKALTARINALEQQIVEEQRRLSAGEGSTINSRLTRYEELLFEHEFAQTAYTSALTFLETTRVSSQKQRSYVIDFVEPNLPDEPTRPERVKAFLTVFIVSFLIWAIGCLLVGALRENARI